MCALLYDMQLPVSFIREKIMFFMKNCPKQNLFASFLGRPYYSV